VEGCGAWLVPMEVGRGGMKGPGTSPVARPVASIRVSLGSLFGGRRRLILILIHRSAGGEARMRCFWSSDRIQRNRNLERKLEETYVLPTASTHVDVHGDWKK
jgi:hypothetical protein